MLDIGKPERLRSKSIANFFIRFYHLTHIGLLLTTLTFCIGLIINNRNKENKREKVYKKRESRQIEKEIRQNAFYTHLLSLTITCECFISILFWMLWVIDESNVVTKDEYVGEDTISFFFNLCMHGIPCIFLLIEFFLSDFKSSILHYFILFFFGLAYVGVMYLFYIKTGEWPYQIIDKFKSVHKLLFFFYCLLGLFGIYMLLSYMHPRVKRKSKKNSVDSRE